MDLHETLIKLEQNAYKFEDSNDNYLQLDFEVGVKIENEPTALEDWCLQNTEYYEDAIAYENIKQKLETIGDNKQVSTCSMCLRMFANRHTLYQHNLEHLQVVLPRQMHLFQCDYCSCCYTSKGKLKRHIQMRHFFMIMNQRKPVSQGVQKCQICRKTLAYKHWHEHMSTMHSTEKIQCRECGTAFKCLKYLRRHLLYVHGGLKPSWRFHNVHLGIELKCSLCPSVFNNRSSYSAHLRNCHSSRTPLECTLCHSKFKSKSYLLTHMKRVHFNDGKLYKCDICFKVFRSPRYLNIHKKNSHYVRVGVMKSKNAHAKKKKI